MLNWRLENRDSFYPTLVQWWEDWGFPILPSELIPNRVYVVYDENNGEVVDLYAVPVYITDSEFAWIGFPTGNKNASKEVKKDAFQFILNIICTTMKYQGYSRVFTTSMTPKIMEEFQKNDFIKSDEGTNFFIKIL